MTTLRAVWPMRLNQRLAFILAAILLTWGAWYGWVPGGNASSKRLLGALDLAAGSACPSVISDYRHHYGADIPLLRAVHPKVWGRRAEELANDLSCRDQLTVGMGWPSDNITLELRDECSGTVSVHMVSKIWYPACGSAWHEYGVATVTLYPDQHPASLALAQRQQAALGRADLGIQVRIAHHP